MMSFERLKRRLRYWAQRSDRARLLREEMDAHMALKADDLEENGMSANDARFEARREFGNAARLQEEARGTWIARWMTDLAQDTGYAWRSIRKRPGFALAPVVSSALGIGACSLIFGIASFALLRPLPVNAPSRLLSISVQNKGGQPGGTLSYPDYGDLKQMQSFEGVTAFFPLMPAALAVRGGQPQRYWGSLASANYFDVVQPPFLLGRGFDASKDDKPGEAPVIVLSHHLWRSRFGADRSIVGQTIALNHRKVTVAGVTAAGFRGTEVALIADFWVPLSLRSELTIGGPDGAEFVDRNSQWLFATGRLREGVSTSTATSEIGVIARRLEAAYPASNKDRGFYTVGAGQIHPAVRQGMVLFFALLLAVCALLLLTACANVANLLLARASTRHKEMATRLAIGAGRGRLIRQVLTESVMLAIAGGVLGLLFASIGANSLGRFQLPFLLPVDFTVSLDYRVMVFSMLLSVATGMIFGLAPALESTRRDLVSGLKDARLSVRGRWFSLRNVLVVSQVAICMVLLVCSGLFLRSLGTRESMDLGLKHRNILLAGFDPSANHDAADPTTVLDEALRNAVAIPGVQSAALTTSVPLSLLGVQGTAIAEERLAQKDKEQVGTDIYGVSAGFFDTLGIRMIAGEDFRAGRVQDDVVILNAIAAEKLFPKQSAIGRRIQFDDKRLVKVIGIAATSKSRTVGEDPQAVLYLPILRNFKDTHPLMGVTLMVRTAGSPLSYVQPVTAAIRAADPTLAIFDVRPFAEHLHNALLLPRAAAFLLGLAGLMGLLIASVGIYGVISFTVARQTKEIGIRMALGARRSQVVAMVLQRGLILTAVGTGMGLGMALALSRMVSSMLYGVSPTDPLTFIAVPLILLVIALTACLVPARRAATLDPTGTLRAD